MSSFVPMSLCSQSLHAQIAVPVLSLLLCATLAPAQATATPPGIRVPALGQMHLCFSRDGSLLRILGYYFFGYAGTVKSCTRGCTVSATPLRNTRSAGFRQYAS